MTALANNPSEKLPRYDRKALEDLSDVVARRSQASSIFLWVLLAGMVVWFLSLFVLNPKLDMGVVAQYLFSPVVLVGLGNTLLMAVTAEVLSIILGIIVGYGRLSKFRALRTASWLYIWLFRSTPLLVQILLWGNLALLIPRLGWGDFSIATNDVMTPFVAGVIALAVHEAAYLAEVVRSGVQSVGRGQREAAGAIGLTWWQTQRRVVLPQALRVMLPQFGSFFVLLLKATALVYVIAGSGLLTATSNIATVNFRTIEMLLVASIWFLAVTSLASLGQAFLERRANRQLRQHGLRQLQTKGVIGE